ncbi:addiction module antidote protein [Stenotrophomonas sp.]|uniref:addiction module antidote protein n=1 Tax=Stenotrophomonas sp. TaxID=69392 RepID=UPI0028AE3CEC|nr:addiction module antidote protein [Stenotrophomonas sp.]
MNRLKTAPFDPADYLLDDEAIATYLSEALAAGDAGHFQEALGTVARSRGMRGVAEISGLGRESLYKALRPDAHPRFDTVQRVLSALGVHLTVQAGKA